MEIVLDLLRNMLKRKGVYGMNQSSMMIRVEVAALSIEREFEFRILLQWREY